ncbi:MAG TPA: sodium:solute symporter [Rhizomicrobium sp.]
MHIFVAADWLAIAVYFAIVFGAVLYSRRGRRRDAQEYFLAGRNVGWYVVGASIFASNIGAEHLVGLAGSGAAGGVAVAQFEILASFILLLLGWLFVPFYLSSGVFTMPEFLERRYSAAPRYYLAGMSIFGYILTKISVSLTAAGIVLQALTGIDFWLGAGILVVITGIYTMWGGLRAVLYTDSVQAIVLLGGSIAVSLFGLHAVGGWHALTTTVGPQFMTLWKPANDPNFPWTGIIFGAPILAIWYWCTDQFIVQRVLSAKNISNAREGTVLAGFLKQTPLFLFVMPGIIAVALVKMGKIHLASPDQAFPTLVAALLPAGIRGLVAASLISALMGSLSSVFNSAATLFTLDIFKRLYPDASERTTVRVGQVGVAAMVIFGLLWIPFMRIVSGQLYTYIQSVQAYVSPPIAAVFLAGVLWPRANSFGAIASLASGFVLGIGRLVCEITHAKLPPAMSWFVGINFLHFAFVLFVTSVVILAVVSLLTAKPDPAQTDGLTIRSISEPVKKEARRGRGRDLVWSALLILTVIGVWTYFSGLMFR